MYMYECTSKKHKQQNLFEEMRQIIFVGDLWVKIRLQELRLWSQTARPTSVELFWSKRGISGKKWSGHSPQAWPDLTALRTQARMRQPFPYAQKVIQLLAMWAQTPWADWDRMTERSYGDRGRASVRRRLRIKSPFNDSLQTGMLRRTSCFTILQRYPPPHPFAPPRVIGLWPGSTPLGDWNPCLKGTTVVPGAGKLWCYTICMDVLIMFGSVCLQSIAYTSLPNCSCNN